MEYLQDEDYKKAAENGLSKHVVYGRFYKYGWSKERAISEPFKKKSNSLWEKVEKTCDENKISQTLFYLRINRGMTIEEASTTPLREPGRKNSCRYKSKNFTPEELKTAEKNGISRTVLKNRFHQGWDKEDAITIPVGKWREKYKKEVTANGI